MQYFRLYTDAAGETHFEDLAPTFTPVNYAPPAPPFFASSFAPALEYGFLRIPAGWQGDWHPVPRRQIQIFLTGELEAQASDGQVRHVEPGMVVLVEDTTGKGHLSRVVSNEDVTIMAMVLPDNV
jgi:hypothetical protein